MNIRVIATDRLINVVVDVVVIVVGVVVVNVMITGTMSHICADLKLWSLYHIVFDQLRYFILDS